MSTADRSLRAGDAEMRVPEVPSAPGLAATEFSQSPYELTR